MFEGECGEVGVGCQVSASAQRKQEVPQRLGVPGAWIDNGYRRLFKPGVHDVEGRRFRFSVQRRVFVDLDYYGQSGFSGDEPEEEQEEELEPPDDYPEPPDDGSEPPPEEAQGEQQDERNFAI